MKHWYKCEVLTSEGGGKIKVTSYILDANGVIDCQQRMVFLLKKEGVTKYTMRDAVRTDIRGVVFKEGEASGVYQLFSPF